MNWTSKPLFSWRNSHLKQLIQPPPTLIGLSYPYINQPSPKFQGDLCQPKFRPINHTSFLCNYNVSLCPFSKKRSRKKKDKELDNYLLNIFTTDIPEPGLSKIYSPWFLKPTNLPQPRYQILLMLIFVTYPSTKHES